jgi:hypothetical protein
MGNLHQEKTDLMGHIRKAIENNQPMNRYSLRAHEIARFLLEKGIVENQQVTIRSIKKIKGWTRVFRKQKVTWVKARISYLDTFNSSRINPNIIIEPSGKIFFLASGSKVLHIRAKNISAFEL